MVSLPTIISWDGIGVFFMAHVKGKLWPQWKAFSAQELHILSHIPEAVQVFWLPGWTLENTGTGGILGSSQLVYPSAGWIELQLCCQVARPVGKPLARFEKGCDHQNKTCHGGVHRFGAGLAKMPPGIWIHVLSLGWSGMIPQHRWCLEMILPDVSAVQTMGKPLACRPVA